MAINPRDLSTGDLVRLASGSPKMAVLERVGDSDVKVLWWSDRLGILTDVLPAELLVYPRPAEAAAAPSAEPGSDA